MIIDELLQTLELAETAEPGQSCYTVTFEDGITITDDLASVNCEGRNLVSIKETHAILGTNLTVSTEVRIW